MSQQQTSIRAEITGEHTGEITTPRGRLLYSYESLAAGMIDGERYLVSDCRRSTTTSRHVSQFFNLDRADRAEKTRALKAVQQITAEELTRLAYSPEPETILSIIIAARSWFDKINGNTYFSARVFYTFANGETRVQALPFQYGNGSQIAHEAAADAEKAGIITDREHSANGFAEPLWTYCERKGIKLHETTARVQARKHLEY